MKAVSGDIFMFRRGCKGLGGDDGVYRTHFLDPRVGKEGHEAAERVPFLQWVWAVVYSDTSTLLGV